LSENPAGEGRIQALKLIASDPGKIGESIAYLKLCIDDINRGVNLEALKTLHVLLETLGITR